MILFFAEKNGPANLIYYIICTIPNDFKYNFATYKDSGYDIVYNKPKYVFHSKSRDIFEYFSITAITDGGFSQQINVIGLA